MSTPAIADILNKLQIADETVKLMQQNHVELQNTLMTDHVDLNTRFGDVSAAVATLTAQLNANAKQVDKNDKVVKEVVVTNKEQGEALRAAIAGTVGQSDGVLDNL